MSGPIIRVGFFGKLPSRGDFVQMRLSRSAITAWDQWLQAVMPAAQAGLGERWAEVWQAAHGWRFALGSGVCGPRPLTGVWLPSTDRVGRTFPLMIAAEAATMHDAFLDAAECIGADAVRGTMTPDMLARRLGSAPRALPTVRAAGNTAGRWWRRGRDPGEELRSDAMPDADAFVRMLTP